jgi:hypothetical protein
MMTEREKFLCIQHRLPMILWFSRTTQRWIYYCHHCLEQVV